MTQQNFTVDNGIDIVDSTSNAVITLTPNSGFLNIDTDNGGEIAMNDGAGNVGSVGIEPGAAFISIDDGGGSQIWNFDADGVVTLPGEGILQSIDDTVTLRSINTGTGNANGVYLGTSGGFGFFDQSVGSNWLEIFRSGTEPQIATTVGNLLIQTSSNATPYVWNFGASGTLTTPGNISMDWLNIGNVGNIASLQADVSLQIVADAENTAPYWTFNNDGNLFVPGGVYGDNSSPLLLDGAGGQGVGYISLPNDAFGGEQVAIVNKFIAGNGIRLETNGGNLFFDNAGDLTAPGNVTAQNFTGNITITGNVTGTSANVDLIAGSYEWSFDNTGNLTLPGNTFSVNYANGNAVNPATKITGSWSVTPGTADYSFTVFGGHTYTMWVSGNIPNGIIVWNATATVTNTNVPVIGTQYGWYYPTGNALVLNSIPSQIIGTAGAISNTEPAVSNTNVFTFSITNNSGSTQVVNYGYVRIS